MDGKDFYNLTDQCDLDIIFNFFGIYSFDFSNFSRYRSDRYLKFFKQKDFVNKEEFICEFINILHKKEQIDPSIFEWILSESTGPTRQIYYSIFSQVSIYLDSNFNSNLLKNKDTILKNANRETLSRLTSMELYCFGVRYSSTK